jgi:hypothetical protein
MTYCRETIDKKNAVRERVNIHTTFIYSTCIKHSYGKDSLAAMGLHLVVVRWVAILFEMALHAILPVLRLKLF